MLSPPQFKVSRYIPLALNLLSQVALIFLLLFDSQIVSLAFTGVKSHFSPLPRGRPGLLDFTTTFKGPLSLVLSMPLRNLIPSQLREAGSRPH
jgi:hypothetical protein